MANNQPTYTLDLDHNERQTLIRACEEHVNNIEQISHWHKLNPGFHPDLHPTQALITKLARLSPSLPHETAAAHFDSGPLQ